MSLHKTLNRFLSECIYSSYVTADWKTLKYKKRYVIFRFAAYFLKFARILTIFSAWLFLGVRI